MELKRGKPFIVGMALNAEKAKKHISPKLIDYAEKHGILLRIIDENLPLESQGTFHAICQKIRRREWEEELEAYAASHPHVSIHDMPLKTYILRNRGTMLTPFQAPGQLFQSPPLHIDSTTADSNSNNDETITNEKLPIRCCAPEHTTIEANTSFTAAKTQLIDAGITYPVLAKSLFADGSGSSHSLAVIRSDAGLLKITQGELKSEGLEFPLLFEQYIDHGKCLFKVYVLGNHEIMVTRPSLHLDDQVDDKEGAGEIEGEIEEERTIDAHMEERRREPIEAAGTSPPVLQLEERRHTFEIAPPDVEVVSRVSAYPRCRSWGKDDLAPPGHGVPAPPEWLWRGIAAKLRSELGLSLFNFDIIVPLTQPVDSIFEKLVHVIDINYFPGIEKLPNYEALLVQFFLDLKNESKSC